MRYAKPITWVLAILLAVILPLGAIAEDRWSEVFDTAVDAGALTVRFLSLTPTGDEKQGDCSILLSPEGLVMVIDAAEPTSARQVVEALEAMGITRIDYLVASHPHIDHIGGFPELLSRFEVGEVYASAVEYTTETYKAYLRAIEAAGVPLTILADGDEFAFGEEVRVQVLHPGREIEYYDNFPTGSTQFINDLSLVLKLTYGEATLLFAGDLYTHGEKEVIQKYGELLRADVYKMNHHGDSTSSSKGWREAVQPKIAVAMHDAIADLKVLEKYHREGAEVYVTFVDGCVKVTAHADGTYETLTQKDRLWDFLK